MANKEQSAPEMCESCKLKRIDPGKQDLMPTNPAAYFQNGRCLFCPPFGMASVEEKEKILDRPLTLSYAH